jgi:hypothetical protein
MKRLALALAFLATPAFAQPAAPTPPHTIDMTAVLMDDSGKPLVDGSRQECRGDPDLTKIPECKMTAGRAIAIAMCNDRPDDRNEAALDKAKRCYLGRHLETKTDAVLTGPQISQIEGRLGAWPGNLLVQLIPLIDPAQSLEAK